MSESAAVASIRNQMQQHSSEVPVKAWLVELKDVARPLYWLSGTAWTTDVNEGCHFRRRIDAERVAEEVGGVAREHEWPKAAAQQLMQEVREQSTRDRAFERRHGVRIRYD